MAVVRSVAATTALFALLRPVTASEIKSVLRPRAVHGQTQVDAPATHGHRQHHDVQAVHDSLLSSNAILSKALRVALPVATPANNSVVAPEAVQRPPPPPVKPNRLRKQNTAVVALESAVEATRTGVDGLDAVVLLKQMGDEVRQNTANVDQLRSTLSADVALLRESAKLERAARSRASRKAAARQVHQSELLVKETGEMLKEGRNAAADTARSALKQAEAARGAAQQLAAEASADLEDVMKQAAGTSAPTPSLSTTAEAAVLAAPQAKMTEGGAGDVDVVETDD
eukprot:TRINITY_DN5210_c0_g2_i1.p1 TRINITY_DN5210_c0_g2~~TRINITY_DN5210_c0_g2_i1.p1  ORF type:complete len:310 (+),score=68.41 TRINITY_DN5210_c0_g2_i1:77-931(+)